MNLTKYLLDQQNIQDALDHPMGEGEEAIKENILALIVEATEVLEHINWKPWKKQRKQIIIDDILEEVVDLFKFCFNILNYLEVTEEEFDNMWRLKNEIIKKRIKDGY